MAIRHDRQATQTGGYGMDIRLPNMRNTSQVCWINGNSYVVRPDGKIISINGIGEVRWHVEEWNTNDESNQARAYFLTQS